MVDAASTQAIARSFGRAAASYDDACEMQQLAAKKLLQCIAAQALQAQLGLDLGCATAPQAAALQAALPHCRFVGVDIALPMLQQAADMGRCSARYLPLCADACRLPFADNSVDLIFSSFALQWTQPLAVLAEMQRVLTQGGILALSVPLAGSLAEIKSSWAKVDDATHVNPLAAASAWREAAVANGFEVQTDHCWHWQEYAPDAMTQLRRIKATGAQHRLQRESGLASRRRLGAFVAAYEQHRTSAGLPLSWELLQLVLCKR